MNTIFTMLFIFEIGCVYGWGLELVFRRIINPAKRWVNPGFLIGPYLPLYGFGLSVLYLIANLERYLPLQNTVVRSIILFILMGLAMTLLEYIAGIIFIKKMKIKLWDYSNMRWNFQGIICPMYSVFWTILGIIYYYALHPHIADAVNFAFKSVITYFVLGLFCGFFIIDLVYSMHIVAKIKAFAEEQQIVVKLEELKANIIKTAEEKKHKARFFRILSNESTVIKNLKRFKGEKK